MSTLKHVVKIAEYNNIVFISGLPLYYFPLINKKSLGFSTLPTEKHKNKYKDVADFNLEGQANKDKYAASER
jgi:hypothetical protein